MIQLAFWDERPKPKLAKVPIFRTFREHKLYERPGGRLIQEWPETIDAVLFTADGQITDNEERAAWMITRYQGIRILYDIWRVHCPEPYDKQRLLGTDAGHSYGSRDALVWKRFIKANDRRVVNTIVYRASLSGAVRE